MSGLSAVVFDFDGTLVDTEWSIYEMAATTFDQFGIQLDVPAWASIVGLAGEDDWFGQLCTTQGWNVDRVAWWAYYDSLDRSARDRLPPQAGVVALLDELASVGIPAAIASSSGREWIEQHLRRLDLFERFESIADVGRTGVGKPAPDVYLLACADLGVDPASCVALEDSAPGLASAAAAGLARVVVPSRITRHSDLSNANLTVASIAELSVDKLRSLVP